jgi:hypothetical protein
MEFVMKRLAIVLAAAVVLGTGTAQAGADHIDFGTAIQLFEPLTWAEKIALIESPWRKKCRKGWGCVYSARMKSEAIIYSIMERRDDKSEPLPPSRQWCVEDVEASLIRCVDQK